MSKEAFAISGFLNTDKPEHLESFSEAIQGQIKEQHFFCALFLIAKLSVRCELTDTHSHLANALAKEIRERKVSLQASTNSEKKKHFQNVETNQYSLAREFQNVSSNPLKLNAFSVKLAQKVDLLKAESLFSYAYYLYPENAEIVLNYTKLLELRGKVTSAHRIYKLFFSSWDTSVVLSYHYLDFLIRQEKYTECLKFISEKQVASNYSSSPNVCTSLGDLELCLGNYDRAISHYNTAVTLGIKNNKLRKQLGFANWAHGNLHAAFENFSELHKFSDNFNDQALLIKFFHSLKDLTSFNHPLARLDERVRECFLSEFKNHNEFDKRLRKFKEFLLKLIPQNLLGLVQSEKQIFTGALSGLKCELYKDLFNKHSVISSRCFYCFKLEVILKDADTLLSFAGFIKKENSLRNFISKCLVDDRTFSKHRYKAIFYCSSISDLNSLDNYIASFSGNFEFLEVLKRRGCSEFTNEYSDFQLTNGELSNFQHQSEDWENIESRHKNLERPVEVQFTNQKQQFDDFTFFEAIIALSWFNSE